MTTVDWLPDTIRGIRRRPIVAEDAGVAVNIGRPELERLLPHRPPMLLLDAVERVDLRARAVRGRRALRPDDLGFAGLLVVIAFAFILTMGASGVLLAGRARRRRDRAEAAAAEKETGDA